MSTVAHVGNVVVVAEMDCTPKLNSTTTSSSISSSSVLDVNPQQPAMPATIGQFDAAVEPLSAAVPPKFYRACRLCLTVVGEAEAAQLSVYSVARSPPKRDPSNAAACSSVIIRNDAKFNNNNQTTDNGDSAGGPAAAESNRTASAAGGSSSSSSSASSADQVDQTAVVQPMCNEAQMELMQCIYTFLNIEVSTC